MGFFLLQAQSKVLCNELSKFCHH